MGSSEFVDPYLDPATGLLRNSVGARTQVALDEAEGDLSFARLVQLMDHPVRATGDLKELRAIHRHLFQDVSEWAGQVRTVDLRKSLEGAEHFLPVSMIGRAASYAAEQLCAENHLRGLDRDRFIERLAYHYDQFNYVHPFREGNGRMQRVFWNRVAREAVWQLDWRTVHGLANDAACRAASERGDLGPLEEMFGQIVTQAGPPAHRDAAWQAAERARLSFPSPATGAVQDRPSEGPSSAPQARSTRMPGRGSGSPGRGQGR